MKRLTAAVGFLAFAAWMALPASAQVIDHPTTFTGQTDLTFNMNASVTAGGTAQLTPPANTNRGSFWTTAQLPVDKFVARFTLHTLGTAGQMADGMGFCLQRVGTAAIGTGGGQMGYAGILTSIFIKFDNYNNESSTGLYLNGVDPTPNSVNMRPNVDLHSQHDFRVLMNYNGTTVAMTVTDLTTSAVYSTTFTVDIPTVEAASSAGIAVATAPTRGTNSPNPASNPRAMADGTPSSHNPRLTIAPTITMAMNWPFSQLPRASPMTSSVSRARYSEFPGTSMTTPSR